MKPAVAYEEGRPVRVDFRSRRANKAAVFIHGFLGRPDTTWGDFPQLLMREPALKDWDVFGIGYHSGLRMDITGLWANNADLEVLGYYLRTTLAHSPFDSYSHLALIAHSMGGLVAQQALVDDATRQRIGNLILFGTPSGGARKALFARRVHAQARDMSEGSAFISKLRETWAGFLPTCATDLRIIAAEKDVFVPPASSLAPFPESVRYVVPGTHSSMVKPKGPDSLSFQIVLNALLGREPMMGRVSTQGTLTFLFTDVVGSTERWERYPAAMSEATERQDAIVRDAIRHKGGTPFKISGDHICSVFKSEGDAVQAAVVAQLALGQENFEAVGGMHVRMAINDGAAEQRHGDYVGPAVNRAGRLLSIANGDQILATTGVVERANAVLPPEYSWRDLGVHRMRDLVEPETVFQLDFPGLRRDFPPLRSLQTLPNNLPAQASPLVGRDKELRGIAELLAGHRIVTLAGAGGIGKTRVALQLGADLLDGTGDGVWFVDLSYLTDPRGVVSTVAATLGVPERNDRPALETLVEHLAQKRLLLILDNCEHVIEAAAAATTAIAGRCPNVSVLATSREPLRVAGESVFRMPSLSAPPHHVTVTGQSAMEYGAIALFVQAAVADDANFRLTDETAPIVADICRRLDGIALAIELAAVRVRVLTPRRLAERLDEQLRVLTVNRRGAVPRQQTLRALIDWSHGLLTAQEQRLFSRLGVFAGGWTLDAAEVVCGDDALDELEVADLMMSLAEKSLIVAEPGDTPRFRMLESLREFAAEKLTAAGEIEALRERQAHWVAAVADREIARWTAPAPDSEEFERDVENARAAIDWALSHNHVTVAARAIVGFASPFIKVFGRHEFRMRVESVLKRLDEQEHPGLAALSWRAFAVTLAAAPKIEAAQRALELAEQCNDDGLITLVLVELAFGRHHAGQSSEAQIAIDRALTLLKGGLARTLYPYVLNLAGVVANESGRYDEARRFYSEAISNATAQHENAEVMAIRLNMAENEFHMGHPVQARELVEAATTEARARGLSSILIGALQNGAAYCLALNDPSAARVKAVEALHLAIAGAFEMHVAILVQHLGAIAALGGDAGRAVRLCGYTDSWYSRVGMQREFSEKYTYDMLMEAVRDKLPAEEVTALLGQGNAMSQQEAITEALLV